MKVHIRTTTVRGRRIADIVNRRFESNSDIADRRDLNVASRLLTDVRSGRSRLPLRNRAEF